ncbi:MAG: D-alanyl-D-alanine carboxypeptidase, partial [Pyrinomonadaceae bacterium]
TVHAAVPDSSTLGLTIVKGFMKQIGVPDDGILQYDGSGLSRHDLITPSAVVTLYTYMAKQSKYAQAWNDSLTIGGVDGTLKNRFKGTAAEGNIRGKTGTIDQVSALSGYMTTAGGEHIVLSIIVNGVAEPRMRTSLADDIVVALANFNGKID